MDKNDTNHTDLSNGDGFEDLLRARKLPPSSAALREVVLDAAEARTTKNEDRAALRKYRRRVAMIPLSLAASVLLVLGGWGYFVDQSENPVTPVPAPLLSKQPVMAIATLAEVDSSLGALRQRLDTISVVDSPQRSIRSARSTRLLERVQTIRKRLESENG